MDEKSFNDMRNRLGDEHLGKRLRAQVDHINNVTGRGLGTFHFENLPPFIETVDFLLKASGLIKIGERNALQFVVKENRVLFPGLPINFTGLRILQLSDLHLDGYPGLGGLIAKVVAGVDFDLCVLTGDFRFSDTGTYRHLIDELNALVPTLQCRLGVFGILGNHDFIEMAPIIEAAGVRLLINESNGLEVNGENLWLTGLDDAHFYGLHDFEKAMQIIPDADARILLVHSPEIIEEASKRGFGLYLTGHTHAGQICFPGGIPLLVNASCKRKYAARSWKYNEMSGYTSAGVGSSGIFARFFCPPEIVIHVLESTT
jgi:predicted MPP superfamily phosphohydrolase